MTKDDHPPVASYILESNLLFGNEFPAPDPKMGLTIYGPYSDYPNKISIAIIGDAKTTDQVRKLLEMCSTYVEGPNNYPLWTQDYPGSKKALHCEFLIKDKWCKDTITENDINSIEKIQSYRERIGFAATLFCNRIARINEREESPTIFICAPPKRMMDLCISSEGEYGHGRRGQKSAAEKRRSYESSFIPSQTKLFDFDSECIHIQEEMEHKRAGDNFHHFLKAYAMNLKTPTQFIKPYTLDKIFTNDANKMQDLATVCWNLTIALYYKAGGRPWRLANIPSGTCFAGITFYREKQVFGGNLGVSLAQVFTPEGEGLVIRGERVIWQPHKDPHLSKDGAIRIMQKVIDTYQNQTGQRPTRIVIHKSSTFNIDETTGFKESMNDIPRHDFISILKRGRKIKFFRAGYHPVIRGTVITLSDDSRFLFTKGYIPFMKVYPGPRVPRPLEIIFNETDTSHDQLCQEILGLSRLNWNSGDFSCLYPITMQFSTLVGRIIRELPPGVTPENRFHYYM